MSRTAKLCSGSRNIMPSQPSVIFHRLSVKPAWYVLSGFPTFAKSRNLYTSTRHQRAHRTPLRRMLMRRVHAPGSGSLRREVPEAKIGYACESLLFPPTNFALFCGLFLFQQKSPFDEAQKNSSAPPCRAPGALCSAGVDL